MVNVKINERLCVRKIKVHCSFSISAFYGWLLSFRLTFIKKFRLCLSSFYPHCLSIGNPKVSSRSLFIDVSRR